MGSKRLLEISLADIKAHKRNLLNRSLRQLFSKVLRGAGRRYTRAPINLTGRAGDVALFHCAFLIWMSDARVLMQPFLRRLLLIRLKQGSGKVSET